MSIAETMTAIRRDAVIGIVRAKDPDTALAQAQIVLGAGLRVVEVALTTPGAVEVIATLVEQHPDAIVGAGTVLDEAAADAVLAVGARLVVSPDFTPGVVHRAAEAGVCAVPGCLTPSEMTAAMRAGAGAVKIFPAHLWSPAALAGLLQALPDLQCVPTGGVDPESAPAWLAAGAVAVGVGSALTSAPDPAAVVARLRRP